METWNKLCEKVQSDRKTNTSERAFEKDTVKYFLSGLGWSEWEDNLIEQYPIKAANTTLYADFALFKKGDRTFPEIIIELKKPNHKPSRKQKEEEVRQIGTYMKQKDCCFGLYFGEKMELYFIDSSQTIRTPKLILSVAFEKNNEDGQCLIGLLRNSNHTFSNQRLLQFCQEQIAINNALVYWCSEEGKEKLYEFIITETRLNSELKNRIRSKLRLNIQRDEVTSANRIIEQKKASTRTNPDNPVSIPTADMPSFIFHLKVPKKGVEATMCYIPQENKYIIKKGSKISKETKESCNDNVIQKREEILHDISAAKVQADCYILLTDIVIISGTPNLSAQFCTGRSTNARKSWKDENGIEFGAKFSTAHKKENVSYRRVEIDTQKRQGNYSLDGMSYPSLRRFVLDVVRKYVTEHPSDSYETILAKFPIRTNNNRTLITQKEWEDKNGNAQNRYFHSPEDILRDSFGKAFLVSNQWTQEDIISKILPLIKDQLDWDVYTKD